VWKVGFALVLSVSIWPHSAAADDSIRRVDLARQPDELRSKFKEIHASQPETITLSLLIGAASAVKVTLQPYEPFRFPRVVQLDGEPLAISDIGGIKRYYRGNVNTEPDSFAFLTVSASGETKLSLDMMSGKFRGELESSGFRLAPAPSAESGNAFAPGAEPDFILPDSQIPEQYDSSEMSRSSPLDTNNLGTGRLTVGASSGWYGPYSIQVPEGQSYVGAVSRGPGNVNVYVSENPDPAVEWSDLDYCEYSSCFISDPEAKTYYLSVYRFSDDYGDVQVDFGSGSEITEGELYLSKMAVELDDDLFAALGSAEAASDYVAQIYAYASLTYEREVKTQLQVSELFLYTQDPYQDTSSASARIEEVREYWRRNKAATDRTLVSHLSLLVSGGVAYLDVLCSQTAGYSVSGLGVQPPTDPENINWDGMVTAHEMGHNFGSVHTHCYGGVDGNSSPVDACYGSESGAPGECWSGARSYPGLGSLTGGSASGRNGTIMSYCHLLAGGMSNITNTFGTNHEYGVAPGRVPAVMARRATQFAAASSACLEKKTVGAGSRYSVAPSASTGGVISPSTSQLVNEGGTISFTLSADKNYSIAGVTGTCPGSLSGNIFTAGPVLADCTVVAQFAREVSVPPSISQIDSGDGSLRAHFDSGSWAGAAQSYTLRCRESAESRSFSVSGMAPHNRFSTAESSRAVADDQNSMLAFHRSAVFREQGLRCSTVNPQSWSQRLNRSEQRRRAEEEDCSLSNTNIRLDYNPSADNVLNIPVQFHIIYKSNGSGYVTQQRVRDQIRVLNDDFSGAGHDSSVRSGIKFSLAGIHYIESDDWFEDRGPADASKFKAELAVDPSKYLNIYTNDAGGGGALGYATYPQYDNGIEDGIVILHSTVGGRNNGYGAFDQGRTLVHEVGHYLGLLHVFEPAGRCGSGYRAADLVNDTSPQLNPDFGASPSYSCGSYSSIENFMNYSDDLAMRSFTPEQVNRMRCSQMVHRPRAYSLTDDGNVFSTTGVRSPLTLNGLRNGVPYSCTVTANGTNSTTQTSRSVTATPRKPTTPAPPIIERIEPSDQEINLVLSVVDSGGLAITNYKATCTDGISQWLGQSATPSVTISGLANGTDYACTATISNQIGESESSGPANRIVPLAGYSNLPVWMLYQAYLVAIEKNEATIYCGTFNPDLVECEPKENLDPWQAESEAVSYSVANQLTKSLPFSSTNAPSIDYGWVALSTTEPPRDYSEDVFHIWFSKKPNGPVLPAPQCEAYLSEANQNFYWTQSKAHGDGMCYLGENKETFYLNFETRCHPDFYAGNCSDKDKKKSRRSYQFSLKKSLKYN